MKIPYSLFIISIVLLGQSISLAQNPEPECVILLHGLARTRKSMSKMERHLAADGFHVVNRGYPSRHHKIEKLAQDAIPQVLAACRKNGASRIHFVTHSMGGILVRYYLKHHDIPELGRVVMLSPPNGGSEVVDKLGNTFLFQFMNGPAGKQLKTDDAALPKRLGKVNFDLGVITGDRSINLFLSLLIPGADDGKVSINNARVEGIQDFLVLHATHPFIMRNPEAIKQTIHFLRYGNFKKENPHKR